MMPPVARLEAAIRPARSVRARVVLYSISTFDDVGDLTSGECYARSASGRRCSAAASTQMEAEGRRSKFGAPRSYPPASFHLQPRTGLSVDAAAVKAAIGQHHTVTVNAGPSSIAGSSPTATAGRAACRQRSAATAVDPATKGDSPRWPTRRKIPPQGVSKEQAHDLLWRRHLGHHRPVPAAPARPRRHHPLRRVDGRMGEERRRCLRSRPIEPACVEANARRGGRSGRRGNGGSEELSGAAPLRLNRGGTRALLQLGDLVGG